MTSGPSTLDITRKAGREYHAKGWVTLAYETKSKAPFEKNWQEKTLDQVNVEDDFKGTKTNIGVLLGKPSGHLVDVDLDCIEAFRLADYFLPPTPAKFGRRSATRGHRLYISEIPKRINWESPEGTLLELRSTGGQTMFPPSIHPGGEPVEWTSEGDPAKVEAEELKNLCGHLAFAAVVLRHWVKSQRNDLELELAGTLLQAAKWPLEETQKFFSIITQEAEDQKSRNRIKSTQERIKAGLPVKGLTALAKRLGIDKHKIKEWLGIEDFYQSRDANIIARDFADETEGIHHWRGDFFCWDGTFWRKKTRDDLNAKLRPWLEQKKVKSTKKPYDIISFSPTKHDVEEIAQALADLFHFMDEREAPFWIEARPEDPDPSNLLPFRNGILNLKNIESFELQKPDPRLFALHRVECDYSPDAQAPEWEKFLNEIFPKADEKDSLQTIEEILGYCLLSDTSHQKAFLWQGASRSGKGTLGRVLRALVGADLYAGPTISSFGEPFGLQPLFEKSVAVISDARGQSRYDPHVIVERILSITGEDPLTINRKNKKQLTAPLSTRLIFASNVTPKLKDPSGVIVTRFIAVKFQESFLGREDTDLTKKLLAELPGIANAVLRGLQRLRKRGEFLQPESGKELLEQMDANTGPVRAFVEECCVLGMEFEINSQELYQEFRGWAIEHGNQAMASSTFGSDLFALNKGIKKGRLKEKNPITGESVNGAPCYRGITLVRLSPAKLEETAAQFRVVEDQIPEMKAAVKAFFPGVQV